MLICVVYTIVINLCGRFATGVLIAILKDAARATDIPMSQYCDLFFFFNFLPDGIFFSNRPLSSRPRKSAREDRVRIPSEHQILSLCTVTLCADPKLRQIRTVITGRAYGVKAHCVDHHPLWPTTLWDEPKGEHLIIFLCEISILP